MRQVWSQQQLADLTNARALRDGSATTCSRRTIQNWESGRTFPRPGSQQLAVVATVLRMEPGDLLYGEENGAEH